MASWKAFQLEKAGYIIDFKIKTQNIFIQSLSAWSIYWVMLQIGNVWSKFLLSFLLLCFQWDIRESYNFKIYYRGVFLSYSGSVVLNFSCFLSVHQFLSVPYTQWKHFAKRRLVVVVLHKAEMQWVWQYGMWLWVWWVWVWWVWITWAAGGVWQEDKADSASSDPSEWVLCCCVPWTPQTQPPALIPILAMLPEVLRSWESW